MCLFLSSSFQAIQMLNAKVYPQKWSIIPPPLYLKKEKNLSLFNSGRFLSSVWLVRKRQRKKEAKQMKSLGFVNCD